MTTVECHQESTASSGSVNSQLAVLGVVMSDGTRRAPAMAGSVIDETSRRGYKRSPRRWLKASLGPGVKVDPPLGTPSEPRQFVGTSIAALVANPARASEVPVQEIPALVVQLAAEQAALSAVQGVLTARLLTSQAQPKAELADRLLTASEVAKLLGMTTRWVQRRARRLPFARKLSDRAVRYSEAGLKRWMVN